MRELGYRTSHLVYNRLIIRNSTPGRKKLIAKDLALMKADKATPHVSTYHILMKLEANEHNIDGVIKAFEEKELKRTWNVIRGLHHVRSKSYLLATEAFARVENLERAEELWLEMKNERGLKEIEQFNSLLSVYCRCGLIEKAIAVMREMTENEFKPNSITYRHLALGCAKVKLMKEALKNIEMGSNLITSKIVRSSTPWLETTLSIMECLAEKGAVENSEKLFEEVKNAKYNRDAFVYNALF